MHTGYANSAVKSFFGCSGTGWQCVSQVTAAAVLMPKPEDAGYETAFDIPCLKAVDADSVKRRMQGPPPVFSLASATRLFAVLLGCLVASATAAAVAAEKLNVLMIIADDLRPDLGCYGHQQIRSPNIDRLASSGMVFERAYCQVALCNPSRASFLTGMRPGTTQVLDNARHIRDALPAAVTLPQFFKQQGYYTQGLGKIYHPGRDDRDSWSVPHWDPQSSSIDTHGEALVGEMKAYYGPEGRAIVQQRADHHTKAGKDVDKLSRRDLMGPAWEVADAPDGALIDGQTAERAIQVLRTMKDQPFFLAVGFLKPHLPFSAPKKYWDLYPPDQIKLGVRRPPRDAPACALHQYSELRACLGIPATGPINDDQARPLIRGYRAATSYMDAQLGRVLAELDRLSLRDRTIVVFFGDHGYQLGEHGLWCKHTNFELATRAPLIIRAPGRGARGQRTAALVEFVDIYPTLVQLAGLSPPAQLEGTSLVPLFERPTRPWKAAAFSEYLQPGKERITGNSIRTERWRYTEWTNAGNQRVGTELYDHQDDPAENENVAGDPKNSAIISDVAQRLQAGWKAALPRH